LSRNHHIQFLVDWLIFEWRALRAITYDDVRNFIKKHPLLSAWIIALVIFRWDVILIILFITVFVKYDLILKFYRDYRRGRL
jgi:hypothetical protein